MLKKALKIEPNNVSCHNNLGTVYTTVKDYRKAAFHFRKAASGPAPSVDALTNLGILCRRVENRGDAVRYLTRAHELAPQAALPLNELAGLYIEGRSYPEAEEALRAYLALRPDDVMALNNLAYVVQQQGRYGEAETLFEQALEKAGKAPEIGYNLRISKVLQGRSAEAEALLRAELEKDPTLWTAEVGLAMNLAVRGHLDKALEILQQVLTLLPDKADVWCDVALVYLNLGKIEDSIRTAQRAVELDPDLAPAHNTLGSAYVLGHRAPLAVPEYKKAISLKPDFIQPYVNLCRTFRTTGDFDQANIYGQVVLHHRNYEDRFFPNLAQLFRGTCDFKGLAGLGDMWDNCDKVSNQDLPALLLDLLVSADRPQDVDKLFALVKRWGAYKEKIAALAPKLELNAVPREGKLRIGFLSSDLRSHSVSRFLIPLMRGYDRSRFEFHCYMSVRAPDDPVQKLLMSLVDSFNFVENMNHWEIARTIRDDGVEILFDLNGFTESTMVEAMAFRPAPVQISWLGYPFSCGLSTIDHVIMDRYVVPDRDKYLVEEPIVMPESWVCFGEFADVPIEELPVDRSGTFTFGTLNNIYKYTPRMIANWAKVLKRVPGSRFLIVRPEVKSVIVCRNIAEQFEKNGVGADRLFLINNKATDRNHLSYYNEIDLSLDTFPLTGGTTTCEAIWMGVPIVSLIGEAFHQRLSNSVLMQCGLDDFCASDDETFVDRAVAAAENRERLRFLRKNLRETAKATALCNQDRFVYQFQEMLEAVAAHHKLR